MVEDVAWWFLLIVAGIFGIFVPMHFIATAGNLPRIMPPPVAVPICATGITLPLLAVSFQTDDTVILLDIASAVLWLIAFIAYVWACRSRSDHG